MNKIRQFVLVLFSFICSLVFVGCSNAADGYFVKGSLKFDPTYYSTLQEISVSVDFDVILPDVEAYDISYTLVMYHDNKKIGEKSFKRTVTSSGNETRAVSEYWNVDYYAADVNERNIRVEISDFTAKAKSLDTSYVGFSIGFGVGGGVLLMGIVALYLFVNRRGGK